MGENIWEETSDEASEKSHMGGNTREEASVEKYRKGLWKDIQSLGFTWDHLRSLGVIWAEGTEIRKRKAPT